MLALRKDVRLLAGAAAALGQTGPGAQALTGLHHALA